MPGKAWGGACNYNLSHDQLHVSSVDQQYSTQSLILTKLGLGKQDIAGIGFATCNKAALFTVISVSESSDNPKQRQQRKTNLGAEKYFRLCFQVHSC